MLTNTFCLSCAHFPVKPYFYFYLHKSIVLVLFTLCSQTLLSFYLCKSNFLVLFTLPSQTLFLCYPACKSNFLLLFTLCSQTFKIHLKSVFVFKPGIKSLSVCLPMGIEIIHPSASPQAIQKCFRVVQFQYLRVDTKITDNVRQAMEN
jgi:hypothetical protein